MVEFGKKYAVGDAMDEREGQKGVISVNCTLGLKAADPECYTTFSDLFHPVIKERHSIKQEDIISQPAEDFGDLDNLGFDKLDPGGKLILSTRVRVARSHPNYGFAPILTREDRKAMEMKTKNVLSGLTGELKGTYHPLTSMSAERKEQLIKEHYLFGEYTKYIKDTGIYNDWPHGRGIFYNDDKTFLVWVNEEDHLRIISMQNGDDLAAVYKRLVMGVKKIEDKLRYARDESLGFLTFCPSNLGTGLRASVLMKLRHLPAREGLDGLCDDLKLDARGSYGADTEVMDNIYDISNKKRLGVSEIDLIKEMVTGVKEIVRLEKELEHEKKMT